MIEFEVLQGQDKGRRFRLTDQVVTVGRSPDCQVQLQDFHLSGEHLQVYLEDDQYIAKDLRSTNGSMILRGTRRILLQGPKQWEAPLKDGDQVLLGDPSSPVILSCHVEVEPIEQEDQQVVARKSRAELAQLADKLDAAPTDMAALYRAVSRISQAGLDLNGVVVEVAESVFGLLAQATHLTILLADEQAERFSPVLARARDAQKSDEPIKMSRAVLRRVVSDRAAVLVADAAEELGGTESVMAAHIMSSMGVPLWKGEEIRGVIQVDNRTKSGIFRERDLELLGILASQASLAVENARLYSKLETAEERARSEADFLKERTPKRSFSDIVGESPAMKTLFEQLEKVIDTRASIHIEGETGTGKELIATAIHYQGQRRDKLFVAANCAALPENLLESELFGHVKGAFTSADRDKKGLFEVADGGTLFLDEIAEMSPPLQARLLRVLQEGEIRPVGSSRTKKVDVRIISATNKGLEDEMNAGRFRQDLYYRLHVFPVKLPPLRERREDIPLLARHFLGKYTKELNRDVPGLSQEAINLLMAYHWPGNIRELENEVQRLVIQSDPGEFVQPEHLSPQIRGSEPFMEQISPKKGTLKEMMEQVERWLLREALAQYNNNKTRTAAALGITREGLHKKISKYGI